MAPLLSQSQREIMDHATTAVSVSAVSSPVWLPWLYTASEIAAILAPILGLLWLVVQIWAKVSEVKRKRALHND